MSGAAEPSVARARMTNPVDAGSDTVVDAVPAEVSASARPPEALLSETIRPEPDEASVMVSNSTHVVGVVAFAVALLAAVDGTVTAASLSRRTELRPTAASASAGTVGACLNRPRRGTRGHWQS